MGAGKRAGKGGGQTGGDPAWIPEDPERPRRWQHGLVVVWLLLGLMVIGGAAFLAWSVWRTEEQERVAKARALAAAAADSLDVDPERSLLLELRAVELSQTRKGEGLPEAANVLHQALAGAWQKQTIMGHEGAVRAVAYAPDGKHLATGGEDGTVRLWDTATAEERLVLDGGASPVAGIAFDPDGGRLAAAGTDGTFQLWDLAAVPDGSGTALPLLALPAQADAFSL